MKIWANKYFHIGHSVDTERSDTFYNGIIYFKQHYKVRMISFYLPFEQRETYLIHLN